MAEIMKKKRNEVIQKVKVKMFCNCTGQTCDCPCTFNTSPSVTGHAEFDASACLSLHLIIRTPPVRS